MSDNINNNSNKPELAEGSAVLCTVKKIERAIVFLDIEGGLEGSMVLSEVAAGRIRNLRAYVAVNKRIVCKVLSIDKGNIHLSLRRVTAKEREEVLERHKKERSLMSRLKTIVDDPASIIEKIKEEYDLLDFLDDAREDPTILNKFFSSEEVKKLESLLAEKEEKEKVIKRVVKLNSFSGQGVEDIKAVLNIEGIDAHYLGSSKFTIVTKGADFKEANKLMMEIIESVESRAKEKGVTIEVSEK